MLAKQHDLYDGWDEQYQCPVLDEDKVMYNIIHSTLQRGL